MNNIRGAIQFSCFYYLSTIQLNENKFEEERDIKTNTFIRGLFQTISVTMVASMTNHSLKTAGLQEIPSSILTTCTLTPLLLSTVEILFSSKNTRQSFQEIRAGIRTITEYANYISSTALVILGHPIQGFCMITAGWLSTRKP